MQQIEKLGNIKKCPFLEHFLICYKFMVREKGLEPSRPTGTCS